MEKQKSIYRSKSRQYVKIDTKIYYTNMPMEEVAVLSYMLTKPDDWDFRIPHMVYETKWSENRIRKSIKGLQEKGYIYIHTFKNEKGRFDSRYFVFENPSLNYFANEGV